MVESILVFFYLTSLSYSLAKGKISNQKSVFLRKKVKNHFNNFWLVVVKNGHETLISE